MIIVIGGIKGGSGKTTIATNLTAMRSLNGYRVLLVDADEQKSASNWSLQREIAEHETLWVTVQLYGSALHSQIQKMKKDYDDIIIDVGGRDTNSQRSALINADIFLVPFQPRSLDIWTLPELNNLIGDVMLVNKDLISYAIINRGDASGKDNKTAQDILSACSFLKCLRTMIGQRKAYSNAATFGLSINELPIKDKKAISEMNKLYEQIFCISRGNALTI